MDFHPKNNSPPQHPSAAYREFTPRTVPANAPAMFFAATSNSRSQPLPPLHMPLSSVAAAAGNSVVLTPASRAGKQGCHSPYASVGPASMLSSSQNSDCDADEAFYFQQQQQQLMYYQPPSQSSPFAAPHYGGNTVHSALSGLCDFIQLPYIAPVDSPTPAGTLPLFLGQIRFETTAAELRWLLQHVSGVLSVKVEPRGPGCFIVHLRSEADVQEIRNLHKRLLFDHSGVWFARDEAQVVAMSDYVAAHVPFLSRRAHLPRDSMVVEEQKVRFATGCPSPFASFQQRQPPQQQAYYAGAVYDAAHARPYFSAGCGSARSSAPPSPLLASVRTTPPPPPYAFSS